MSFVALKDEVRTARKEYRCDACRWWNNAGMTEADCTTDEQRAAVAAAKDAGWKIRVGDKYRYVRGPYEGQMSTWRARVDIDDLCAAHKLYDDEY
jgi:methenyltetrahydromethanopterin cyclohydrolase